MNLSGLVFIILIAFFVIFAYWLYRKNFKTLVCPNFSLITGGVKCGKSLLTVKLSMKDFKHRHLVWYFTNKILKIRHDEEPMFYTNGNVSFGKLGSKKPHKLDRCIFSITKDLLFRETRFAYGSVIYFDEASLLADNMDIKDKERNAMLSIFCKLIGHETKGGALYYDTQSVLDVHYSFKRCSSTYFFIQKKLNIGIAIILYVREMINTENGVNNFVDDVETTTRKVFVPRWWFKKYDRYQYSYLTDELPVSKDKDTKNGLVSFNPLYTRLADRRKKDKKDKKEEKAIC